MPEEDRYFSKRSENVHGGGGGLIIRPSPVISEQLLGLPHEKAMTSL